jgi:TetR/AcrR family transcriptional regulator, cholesterol catabolism regulator
MGTLKAFQTAHDLSPARLCGGILDRHRDTIRIKKRPVAIANLERIISATLAISIREGFHAMSLRDLMEETGLSIGALYAYFDTKETLLMMILREVHGVIERVFVPPPELAEDPLALIRWLLRTHVYLTETMPRWFIFAFMEARAFDRPAREYTFENEQLTEGLIAAALEQGRRTGVFSVEDTLMTAALIKPMLQDWYVKRWKYRRRGIGAEDYADSLLAFVETALGVVADGGASLGRQEASVAGDVVSETVKATVRGGGTSSVDRN